MSYYPVLLDLTGRRVAVVGHGAVALEKIEGLLAAGASVVLFAEQPPSAELEELASAGRIEVVRRPPRDEDLRRVALVLAERSTPEGQAEVFAAAEDHHRFCNVQDDVPNSSFIAPAIVRRGDLVVAISTSGAAPALAVRLRQYLSTQLGAEYAHFLSLARRLRRPLAAAVPDFSERRRRWYRLVDSEVWTALRRGDLPAAEQVAHGILGVQADA